MSVTEKDATVNIGGKGRFKYIMNGYSTGTVTVHTWNTHYGIAMQGLADQAKIVSTYGNCGHAASQGYAKYSDEIYQELFGEANYAGQYERCIPAIFYDVDGKEVGRLVEGKLIPEAFKQKFEANGVDDSGVHFKDTLIISPYVSWWPGYIAPKDARKLGQGIYLTTGNQISRAFDLKTPEGDYAGEHSGEEFEFRRGVSVPVDIEDSKHGTDELKFKITLATHNMAQLIFKDEDTEKAYFEFRAQALQHFKQKGQEIMEDDSLDADETRKELDRLREKTEERLNTHEKELIESGALTKKETTGALPTESVNVPGANVLEMVKEARRVIDDGYGYWLHGKNCSYVAAKVTKAAMSDHPELQPLFDSSMYAYIVSPQAVRNAAVRSQSHLIRGSKKSMGVKLERARISTEKEVEKGRRYQELSNTLESLGVSEVSDIEDNAQKLQRLFGDNYATIVGDMLSEYKSMSYFGTIPKHVVSPLLRAMRVGAVYSDPNATGVNYEFKAVKSLVDTNLSKMSLDDSPVKKFMIKRVAVPVLLAGVQVRMLPRVIGRSITRGIARLGRGLFGRRKVKRLRKKERDIENKDENLLKKRQVREQKNATALQNTKDANIHYGTEKKMQQAFQEAKVYLRSGQPAVLPKKLEQKIISDNKSLEKSLAGYDAELESKFRFAVESDQIEGVTRSAEFFLGQFVLNIKSERGVEVKHKWGAMVRFSPELDDNDDIARLIQLIESSESTLEEQAKQVGRFFKEAEDNMEPELYNKIKEAYRDGDHAFVVDAFKAAFIPTMNQRLKDFENNMVKEGVVMPTFADEKQMKQFFKEQGLGADIINHLEEKKMLSHAYNRVQYAQVASKSIELLQQKIAEKQTQVEAQPKEKAEKPERGEPEESAKFDKDKVLSREQSRSSMTDTFNDQAAESRSRQQGQQQAPQPSSPESGSSKLRH